MSGILTASHKPLLIPANKQLPRLIHRSNKTNLNPDPPRTNVLPKVQDNPL